MDLFHRKIADAYLGEPKVCSESRLSRRFAAVQSWQALLEDEVVDRLVYELDMTRFDNLGKTAAQRLNLSLHPDLVGHVVFVAPACLQ